METEEKMQLQVLETFKIELNNRKSIWYFNNKGDIGILYHYNTYSESARVMFGSDPDREEATTVSYYMNERKGVFKLPFDDISIDCWSLVFREFQGGFLAFQIIEKDNIYRENTSYKALGDIYYYVDNNIEEPPVKIEITNLLETKSWRNNVGYFVMYPEVYRIGSTTGDTFPVILNYSTIRSERQIGLLKIDINTRKAEWLTTKHDEFITVNWAEILQYREYELSETELNDYYSEEEQGDGVLDNYYDHFYQLLWLDVWYIGDIIYCFSPGCKGSSKWYDGWSDVLLLRLAKRNGKFTFIDIVYEVDEDDAYDDGTYPRLSISWNLSSPICVFHNLPRTLKDSMTSVAYDLINDKLLEIELPKGKEKYRPSIIISNMMVLVKDTKSSKNIELITTQILN